MLIQAALYPQDMLWAVLAEAEGLEIRAPKRWVAVATRLMICASGAVVGYLVCARLCRGSMTLYIYVTLGWSLLMEGVRCALAVQYIAV